MVGELTVVVYIIADAVVVSHNGHGMRGHLSGEKCNQFLAAFRQAGRNGHHIVGRSGSKIGNATHRSTFVVVRKPVLQVFKSGRCSCSDHFDAAHPVFHGVVVIIVARQPNQTIINCHAAIGCEIYCANGFCDFDAMQVIHSIIPIIAQKVVDKVRRKLVARIGSWQVSGAAHFVGKAITDGGGLPTARANLAKNWSEVGRCTVINQVGQGHAGKTGGQHTFLHVGPLICHSLYLSINILSQ